MMNSVGYTAEGEPYDLGKFRYAAAAFLKFMIRARAKHQPDFLTPEDYCRWKLDDIDKDPLPCQELLRRAQGMLLKINSEYIPRSDSGGIHVNEGQLQSLIAFFVDYQYDLPQAINVASDGGSIDWEELAAWDTLDEIRKGLDELPHPGETPVEDRAREDLNVSLNQSDWIILRTLASNSALRWTHAEIEAASADFGGRVATRTISNRKKMLIEQELVRKEPGERGIIITGKGLRIVETKGKSV